MLEFVTCFIFRLPSILQIKIMVFYNVVCFGRQVPTFCRNLKCWYLSATPHGLPEDRDLNSHHCRNYISGRLYNFYTRNGDDIPQDHCRNLKSPSEYSSQTDVV